jgi:hypothetical protein
MGPLCVQIPLSCNKCQGCGLKTAASGTFSDGSGIANYGDFADCKWLISPSGAARITITFTMFQTELGYDFARVYLCADEGCISQQQVARLSGSYTAPQVVTVNSGHALVWFSSDSSVSAAGFNASWTSEQQQTTPAPTPSDQVSRLSGLVCIQL